MIVSFSHDVLEGDYRTDDDSGSCGGWDSNVVWSFCSSVVAAAHYQARQHLFLRERRMQWKF